MICLPAGGYRSRCGCFTRGESWINTRGDPFQCFDKSMIYLGPTGQRGHP